MGGRPCQRPIRVVRPIGQVDLPNIEAHDSKCRSAGVPASQSGDRTVGCFGARSLLGRWPISAARTARPAPSRRDPGLARRSTATSCRSTSTSAFVDADERPGTTSQPPTPMKMRQSRRRDTADHHGLLLTPMHRCNSQARQTSDTPQAMAPVVRNSATVYGLARRRGDRQAGVAGHDGPSGNCLPRAGFGPGAAGRCGQVPAQLAGPEGLVGRRGGAEHHAAVAVRADVPDGGQVAAAAPRPRPDLGSISGAAPW